MCFLNLTLGKNKSNIDAWSLYYLSTIQGKSSWLGLVDSCQHLYKYLIKLRNKIARVRDSNTILEVWESENCRELSIWSTFCSAGRVSYGGWLDTIVWCLFGDELTCTKSIQIHPDVRLDIGGLCPLASPRRIVPILMQRTTATRRIRHHWASVWAVEVGLWTIKGSYVSLNSFTTKCEDGLTASSASLGCWAKASTAVRRNFMCSDFPNSATQTSGNMLIDCQSNEQHCWLQSCIRDSHMWIRGQCNDIISTAQFNQGLQQLCSISTFFDPSFSQRQYNTVFEFRLISSTISPSNPCLSSKVGVFQAELKQ